MSNSNPRSNPRSIGLGLGLGLGLGFTTRSTPEHVAAKRTAQIEKGVVRNYMPPTHMPVLFNVNVLKEMEQRWAAIFARTRAHRAREANELELNFFYQNCAPAPRASRCHRTISNNAIALLLLGRTSRPTTTPLQTT